MSNKWRLLCFLNTFFILFFSISLHCGNSLPLQYPCKPPHHNTYPFCNTSLSISTRAQSLISHLTLHEKIQQLNDNSTQIPRLGIPAYEWWSEALHGIGISGPGVSFNGPILSATNFPQVIVSASSFNTSLWFSIASAIAVEARAMHNVGQSGLTFWAPNINIFRDPRWGRGQETPGEDPMVASVYSVQFVRGFQGESWSGGGGGSDDVLKKRVLEGSGDGSESSGDRMMLSACCKHYTAYDLDNWDDVTRYNFNAVVSKQDMEDSYQPPFKSCIQEGKASCLMCSYNAVNGVPTCARQDLLEKARIDWGFKGYITSDCDAVLNVYEDHKYTKTPEDAVADVLKAGMDVDCGPYVARYAMSAVKQGKLQEEDIDRALFNLFSVQLRVGLFDGDPTKGPFGKFGIRDVCTPEHRELALEAARQGIVLLKNNHKFLPLNKKGVESLAVIGPVAKNTSNMGGGYSGYPCNPRTYVEGLEAYIPETYYAAGCLGIPCESDEGFAEAVEVARKVDFVIVVVGLDLTQEAEERDRVSLLLPGKQMALVSAVAAASKRPVVLVLTGGGPLDVSFIKDDQRIASIVWVGYPGEVGGKALAEVIFGETNPGGRLSVTWYPESFTKVPMTDMAMRADPSRGYPGRTYRFYTGETVYEFGYGLSYTSYTSRFLSVPNKISLLGSSLKTRLIKKSLPRRRDGTNYIHIDEVPSCDALSFYAQISVENNGDMDGGNVVMLFSKVPSMVKGAPQKQLIGFTRVYTTSYSAVETSILVDPCKHLSIANEDGSMVLPLGDHILMLEGSEHSISIGI